MSECLLKRGQTILFDGDSLVSRRGRGSRGTWPFLRMSNWHETWAEPVANWLFCNRPDLKLSFFNAAIGGSTAQDMLDRIETAVLPYKPDWILLNVGGNDQARGVSMKEFKATMAEYCRRVAEHSGARCMALSGWKPCPHCPEHKAARQAGRMRYFKAVKQVIEAAGGIWVDVGTPLQKKARLLYKQHEAHTVYSDGGHYNAVGNQIAAMQALQALGVIDLLD